MAIDLHGFQLILLRRPDNAPSLDSETLDRIQRDHLAFYAAMREAGHVVTNGPVLDPPDQALRGIAIFATESVDRARALASVVPCLLFMSYSGDVQVPAVLDFAGNERLSLAEALTFG